MLAKRGGNGTNSTITVRKVSNGIGVERIFPLQLPTITAIEVVKQLKVRRAKLYYMRDYGKKIKEVDARVAQKPFCADVAPACGRQGIGIINTSAGGGIWYTCLPAGRRAGLRLYETLCICTAKQNKW